MVAHDKQVRGVGGGEQKGSAGRMGISNGLVEGVVSKIIDSKRIADSQEEIKQMRVSIAASHVKSALPTRKKSLRVCPQCKSVLQVSQSALAGGLNEGQVKFGHGLNGGGSSWTHGVDYNSK